MRPLLLAGPPAAGKSSTGRRLAGSRPRGAFVDVDDIRHLVVGGHAAPWDGDEGRRQQRLGIENTGALVRRFTRARVDVVLADVITVETLSIYREEIADLLIIGLRISLPEAERRASGRPLYLTKEEFRRLHDDERRRTPAYDHVVDVDQCDSSTQVELVRRLWT